MIDDKVQSRFFIKAHIACFILQLTPFIRMIALNGSLARKQANKNSDIDFLIISKENRIWTCRAVSVLLMALFGLKRYEDKISGRVCLNLYQTENHLALSTHNKFLARNYAYTIPFWQTHDLFRRFMRSNTWIKNFDKSFVFTNYRSNFWLKVISALTSLARFIAEFLFDLILNDWGEGLAKKYQVKRIMTDMRTLKAEPDQIYLSDEELRFHPHKIPDSGSGKRLTI